MRGRREGFGSPENYRLELTGTIRMQREERRVEGEMTRRRIARGGQNEARTRERSENRAT